MLPEQVHAHLCPVCFDLKTDCAGHKWNGDDICNKCGYKTCICPPPSKTDSKINIERCKT
jgi:hypothetical protein